MKKMHIFSVIALSVFVLISACKKDDSLDQSNNDVLKRYLELKSGLSLFQKNNGDANTEALLASIFSNSKKKLKLAGDSSVSDTGYWEYITCAKVTESIDNEGNNVTVYDYGIDGCEEYGYVIKGKVTYIWSQIGDKYYSKVIYENYSAWGMTMNGYSEYAYTFSDMGIYGNEGCFYNYSGSYSCVEHIEMTGDVGDAYVYSGNYSSEWDENSSIIHVGDYSYKNVSQNFEYQYKVIKDLIYTYSCGWEVYVPVSGIEQIIFKDNENDVNYVTDYGDGTCDNIAVITENGVSYTVDFGELWYSEPCETGDCDSTVVIFGKK